MQKSPVSVQKSPVSMQKSPEFAHLGLLLLLLLL